MATKFLDGCQDCQKTKPKPIPRWALWSKRFGFYKPLPHQTEILFHSRRAAIAAQLSGSHYSYHPLKVELRISK